MSRSIFVALAAGLASAVLLGSALTPSFLSLFLLYLVPLPLFIATLGWGLTTGVAASAAAAIALVLALGGNAAITHLVGFAVPALVLGYLTMLARPIENAPAGTVEWYPFGKIVLWAAAMASCLALVPVLLMGPDAATFYDAMRERVTAWLDTQPELKTSLQTASEGGDLTWIVDQLVFAMVPSAAIVTMLALLGNLWMANKVVRASGRHAREWQPFSEMTLPATAAAAAAVAIIASLMPGTAGLMSTAPAAALLCAYTMLGLAVIHALAANLPGRPLLLGAVYMALFLFSWIAAFAFAALGLMETALKLRDRQGRSGPPPDND